MAIESLWLFPGVPGPGHLSLLSQLPRPEQRELRKAMAEYTGLDASTLSAAWAAMSLLTLSATFLKPVTSYQTAHPRSHVSFSTDVCEA